MPVKLLISRILLTLLLLITGIVSAQAIDSNGNTLRIMTFNIYHGATMKGDYDLDHIAGVINTYKPDLVALQEVDRNTNRCGNLDLAQELEQRTDMYYLFGKAMNFDDGQYGVAVLSQTPIHNHQNHPLPHQKGNEPRTALMITTIISPGDTISFVCTHLDYKPDDSERIEQVRDINQILLPARYPIILAGDLNDTPGSRPISILEQQWESTYDNNNPKPTFPSHQPARKIDYIMFAPLNYWHTSSSTVIPDSVASDHCAYLVELARN